MPIHISPCASLFFPAYDWLSLPHIEPSLVLSCVLACLPYLTVLFWKYSECVHYNYQNNCKWNKTATIKVSTSSRVVRSRAYCPYTALLRVHWTYDGRTSEKFRHSTHLCGARSRSPQLSMVRPSNELRSEGAKW